MRVCELHGEALDWAVGEAIGAYKGRVRTFANSEKEALIFPGGIPTQWLIGKFSPSTRWSQCGPLLEKYQMDIFRHEKYYMNGFWVDDVYEVSPKNSEIVPDGDDDYVSTDLKTAICRAIVASTLGSNIELPEGLIGEYQGITHDHSTDAK